MPTVDDDANASEGGRSNGRLNAESLQLLARS